MKKLILLFSLLSQLALAQISVNTSKAYLADNEIKALNESLKSFDVIDIEANTITSYLRQNKNSGKVKLKI